MSWRIDDHPDGGLMITHLVAPRFTARWTTGAFPLDEVREGGFIWTDEGSGEEDAIYLYGFEWNDEQRAPHQAMDILMREAVEVIEGHITGAL
jgi:hypothetical protein